MHEYECTGECSIKGICKPCFKNIGDAPSLRRKIAVVNGQLEEEIRRSNKIQRAYEYASKKADEHCVICDGLKNEIADLQANIIEERRELREALREAQTSASSILASREA